MNTLHLPALTLENIQKKEEKELLKCSHYFSFFLFQYHTNNVNPLHSPTETSANIEKNLIVNNLFQIQAALCNE